MEGADPASSPELALRAQELVSPRFRTRMAAALRSTIEIAERPWTGRWSAQVPLQSDEILAERDTLRDLARDMVHEPSISAAEWPASPSSSPTGARGCMRPRRAVRYRRRCGTRAARCCWVRVAPWVR